jgi:hypothetical protein
MDYTFLTNPDFSPLAQREFCETPQHMLPFGNKSHAIIGQC